MANVADGDGEEPFLLSDPDEDEFSEFSPVRGGVLEEHTQLNNKQQVKEKKGPSKMLNILDIHQTAVQAS